MNPLELEQTRLKYVRITNNLSVPFTDRYDGVPITIMPGKSENLPLDMAAHFLGPDLTKAAMFRHVCKRQGWNTPKFLETDDSGKTLAERNFAGIAVEPVTYRLVADEKPDPRKPVPAEQDVGDDETEAARVARGDRRGKRPEAAA